MKTKNKKVFFSIQSMPHEGLNAYIIIFFHRWCQENALKIRQVHDLFTLTYPWIKKLNHHFLNYSLVYLETPKVAWYVKNWMFAYHNNPKYLDRHAWANSVDPNQMLWCLIRVYTDCHSSSTILDTSTGSKIFFSSNFRTSMVRSWGIPILRVINTGYPSPAKIFCLLALKLLYKPIQVTVTGNFKIQIRLTLRSRNGNYGKQLTGEMWLHLQCWDLVTSDSDLMTENSSHVISGNNNFFS